MGGPEVGIVGMGRATRLWLLGVLTRVAHSRAIIRAALGSFLLGLLANVAVASSDYSDFVRRLVDPRRYVGAWFVLVVVGLLFAHRLFEKKIDEVLGRTASVKALARFLDGIGAAHLQRFAGSFMVLGPDLVILPSPDPTYGWRPSQIRIVRDPSPFVLPSGHTGDYPAWLSRQQRVPYGHSFRLMENPVSFSDSPDTLIRVQECDYGFVKYFQKVVAAGPERDKYIDRAVRGEVDFASSLCLHAVVATIDRKVLIVQRLHGMDYYEDAWACSIEEQLKLEDVAREADRVVDHWVDRMLVEELGFRAAELEDREARILAVFYETDILNAALAALVTLRQSYEEVEDIMRRPRPDHEFQAYEWLDWNDLPRRLVAERGAGHWHPTARLRMFLAGVAHFSPFEFERLLAREMRQRR